MDSFKQIEIERMRHGGNCDWREFFEHHEHTKSRGIGWDSTLIADRYSGEVGDEWKERLTAKVEGREYVPVAETQSKTTTPTDAGVSETAPGDSINNQAAHGLDKVEKGFPTPVAASANPPTVLQPSQDKKYGGFGNTSLIKEDGRVKHEEMHSDPVVALTKGIGWFTATLTKTAKTVTHGYIQPSAKQVSFRLSLPCPP